MRPVDEEDVITTVIVELPEMEPRNGWYCKLF